MNRIIVTDSGSASRPMSTLKSPATTQSKSFDLDDTFAARRRPGSRRPTMPRRTRPLHAREASQPWPAVAIPAGASRVRPERATKEHQRVMKPQPRQQRHCSHTSSTQFGSMRFAITSQPRNTERSSAVASLRRRMMATTIARPTTTSAAATTSTKKTEISPPRSFRSFTKGDEGQVHRVEHELDAHEHDQRVAPDQQPDGTHREQNRGEHQVPGGCQFHQASSTELELIVGRQLDGRELGDRAELALGLAGQQHGADHRDREQQRGDLECEHVVGEQGAAELVDVGVGSSTAVGLGPSVESASTNDRVARPVRSSRPSRR